jgi:hypothetical protein
VKCHSLAISVTVHMLASTAISFGLPPNHHENRVIALEPGVLRALVEYARQVDRAAGQKYFGV